jgi:hypothetical protein
MYPYPDAVVALAGTRHLVGRPLDLNMDMWT